MSRENSREDKFVKEIDELIVHGGREPGEIMDAGKANELDIARKVLECRAEPSEKFKNRLRGKLLQKLAAKENETTFHRKIMDIFAVPAWRVAAVPITIMVLAVVILWGLGVFSSPSGPPLTSPPLTTNTSTVDTTPTHNASLEISATSEQVSYLLGQEIIFNINFRNITGEILVIAQFPPECSIVNSSQPEQVSRSFSGNDGSLELQPNENYVYTIKWDQLSNDGKQVVEGDYQLTVSSVHLPDGIESVNALDLPLVNIHQ